MDQKQTRSRGRPRNDDLTERQRHILRLISAGRTNGEIATLLPLSLDGVKYHVREICDHLRVNTREEAAEWWRQQQGLKARFRLPRHWIGLPLALRWAGGAAGLMVVFAVGLAVVLGNQDDSAELDRHPVRIAYTLPVVDTGDGASQPADNGAVPTTLRVVDGDGQNEESLITAAFVDALSWSPDGHHLAALARPANRADPRGLVLYRTGDRRVITTEEVTGIRDIAWGPRGEELYAFSATAVYELAVNGDIIRSTSANVPALHLAGIPLQWSPDGRYLLVRIDRNVAIFDRETLSLRAHPVALGGELPPDWGQPDGGTLALAARWTGQHSFEFMSPVWGGEAPEGAGVHVRAEIEPGGDLRNDIEIVSGFDWPALQQEWWPGGPAPLALEEGLRYANFQIFCTPICTAASQDIYVVTVAHAPGDVTDLETLHSSGVPWPAGTRVTLAWLRDGNVEELDVPFAPRGEFRGIGRFHDANGYSHSVVHVRE